MLASSRTPPAAPLQAWMAHPQTRLLGWAQLRLDREESAALATRLLGHAPDPRCIELADGWAAALVLLARLEHTDIRLPGGLRGEPAEAFALLAEASFRSLPAPARKLLTGTAFASRVTASLAARCADVPDAADHLAALWRGALFRRALGRPAR
ncbi:MAG: hypothetical protein R3E68_14910 [Burkholderiaceae bacterium]